MWLSNQAMTFIVLVPCIVQWKTSKGLFVFFFLHSYFASVSDKVKHLFVAGLASCSSSEHGGMRRSWCAYVL